MKVYVLEVGSDAYDMCIFGVYDSEEKALVAWEKLKVDWRLYDLTEEEVR